MFSSWIELLVMTIGIVLFILFGVKGIRNGRNSSAIKRSLDKTKELK